MSMSRTAGRARRPGSALVAVAAALLGGDAPADGPHDRVPEVRVWVTTPDRQLELADQGTVRFVEGGSDQLTIVVDGGRRFQRMVGFGASITDSSAAVLYRLEPAARDAVMESLFHPRRGNGLSVLRQPMGGSDFVAQAAYTYDDMPPGQTDFEMRHFSIAHDEAQILPLLRQALALNPELRIIASPWSPPAWMKTNGSLVGGELIDDPRIYRAYADYFVEFLLAYERAGVPVYAVTTQNEPQNRNPSGYPGMYMSAAQQARFIAELGPALLCAGLDTRILAYDHNWSMHPDDIAATPPGETPETEYRAWC
jgi:glucosylceramidase